MIYKIQDRRAFLAGVAAGAASMLLGRVPALGAAPTTAPATRPAGPWLGVHLLVSSGRTLDQLAGQMPKLAALGVNAVVVELGYSFEFKSHPELRNGSFISAKAAHDFSRACRENGVRPIPQFNCLGHQSWKRATFPLLTKYPQFDETPGQYPGNEGIYCRSWCPLHPDVNGVVFALIDDIAEAFEADAFHVGMDEVFLVASEHCPRCKGKDPAEVFAKAVNDLHGHVVKARGWEMMMWADRLIDAKATGNSKWEAADNGTAAAADRVAKDIVMCDWHYGRRKEYPSVTTLMDKGFRVWPSGWDKVDATEALVDFSLARRGKDGGKDGNKMLGHLCTTWGKVGPDGLADFPPLKAATAKWRGMGTTQIAP